MLMCVCLSVLPVQTCLALNHHHAGSDLLATLILTPNSVHTSYEPNIL